MTDTVPVRDLVHPELAGVGLTTAFQPIVDLASGEVVAHEALVRGPCDGLRRPDQLFDAARAEGMLVEFDETCRVTALDTALAAGVDAPPTLFMNVEPEAIPDHDAPPQARRFMREGGRIVMEFTERALTADPAKVQWFAARLRSLGVAIALDDVGIHPASLALMPFLRPEIVKLDMSIVQGELDDEAARVVAAVGAYAEQNHATVLAEGIETDEHRRMALALGARLGQGYHYAFPGPLWPDPRVRRFPDPMFASRPPSRPVHRSPVDVVAEAQPLRHGTGADVLRAAEIVERRALTAEGPLVMLGSTLGCLPPGEHARRWAEAAGVAALCALLGQGHEPLPGVRGTEIAPDDPLRDDLTVVVVGPHVATALVARPAHDGLFDHAVVYDRGLVLEAAHSLMGRIVPSPGSAMPC